ncbi:MAG: TDP-N-acetylfucosamine:lipid II N-acetylfucosaminyltransferase [Microcella sp.]|uniref:TDP-N-acetylfucosamine:lipid II N-acetylfucosaminyltransferase n=1 Tax=Microcella sp. TaxID=1913979 RepID=UPI0024C97FAA|nr:TDP-N-acetylfucosamine:lipid II N-acetylfucosaminyltransferase [Microcella sp.]UYN82564.1 MAG: TDP-N-acetylfucosamine:lipid II N-acetylfucosaminyltransferase [Microcella sp.]
MSTTITHLIPDSTFLRFVVDSFEDVLPEGNDYFVYGSGLDLERHRLPSGVRVQAIGSQPDDLLRVERTIANSSIFISHSMSTFAAEAMISAPSSSLRVWSGWGGEYYGNAFNTTAGLLGPRTARLMRKSKDWRQLAERAYATPWLRRLYRGAAEAADVFSAPVPTDFEVFKRRFPQFRGRYHQLNYASVESTYGLPPADIAGDSILLGNSASPENNHLETLELLAAVKGEGRKILVPLSYGDARYGDDVEAGGRELLGERFVPIREFMTLADYSALVSQCSVVVMGHRRQQALGNVARAIWQGAHVYLDRRNPIGEYFRSKDLPFSTLDELRRSGLPETRRSSAEVSHDRLIASNIWGRHVVQSNIRTLIDSR